MRVTEAIRVDHEYRHYRKAQTLLQTLERRMEWYKRHTSEKITPLHVERYDQITGSLRFELFNENLVWEINTLLSRRPILLLPVKTTLEYVFQGLPLPRKANLTHLETKMVELMNIRARNIAAQQHKFNLMCEIAYRAYHKWFMVFNTLTVAPGEYLNVFSKNSKAFKNYIRTVERQATIRSMDKLQTIQNTHFACVEEGGQHGRLHIHCLHFLRNLPPETSDPNYGKIRPDKRELHNFRQYWKYGRSMPLMVRYSPQDAYGLAGYRWQLDHETGLPMQIKSPLALSNYMSKYITKGYNSCQRSKLLWRVRKSHHLGQDVIREIVEQLSTSTLLILASSDNLRAKLNNTKIPQNLLRLNALKILQNRLSTTQYKEFTSLTQVAKLTTPRLSPLLSSRASIQVIQENNQQSTTLLSTLDLNNADTFNTAWKELSNVTRQVDDKYFPRTTKAWGAGSARDIVTQRTT